MRRSLAILTGLVAMLAAPAAATAAELVMVRQDGCHYCEQWETDVGGAYHKTDEAERAPLRRVDITALPDDVDFDGTPVFTPTFVLVADGRELGRIEGYPGERFFWPLLAQLLAAYPDATRPGS